MIYVSKYEKLKQMLEARMKVNDKVYDVNLVKETLLWTIVYVQCRPINFYETTSSNNT